eukprot:8101059-Pyramimonas_sp.AAC.1
MTWAETDWKDFLRGALREFHLGHVLEYGFIRDPVCRYRMETNVDEMTEGQLQRDLDREARRLGALNEDGARWEGTGEVGGSRCPYGPRKWCDFEDLLGS